MVVISLYLEVVTRSSNKIGLHAQLFQVPALIFRRGFFFSLFFVGTIDTKSSTVSVTLHDLSFCRRRLTDFQCVHGRPEDGAALPPSETVFVSPLRRLSGSLHEQPE